MRRYWRYAFAGVAWLFLVILVATVLMAGAGLFGASAMSTHIDLGWALHLLPVPLLLLAWPARPGRTTVWLTVALLVAVAPQPFLPGLRADLPWIAALHPVNALVIFGLSALIAYRSIDLVRGAVTAPAGPPPAATGG
jgi:hypothetical protein